jgi:DNA-directed RNA polymerase subunit RPC12/RpoP
MGYVKCRKCGSTRWKRVLTNTEIAECSVFNYEKEGLGLEDRNIDVKQELEDSHEYTYHCVKCGKKMQID